MSSTAATRVSCEPCATRDIQLHNFTDDFMGMKVYFQLYMMNKSIYIWVGSARPAMSALNVALLSPFDATASVTQLLGQDDEMPSALAQRLAKATGRVVFLSYTLPANRKNLEATVQRRLVAEIAMLDQGAAAVASEAASSTSTTPEMAAGVTAK